MAPHVINLEQSDDPRDAVHRAVQVLAEGKLVAIPTETVYGVAASALHEEAVQRLLRVKDRPSGHPLTLAVKSGEEALDYAPGLSLLGQRLARRCWPGPVTLILNDDHPDSVVHQLPATVRLAVSPEKSIGLRVPAHPVLLSILRLTSGPLVLTSANRRGGPDAVTATEVADSLGDDVELILDDGRCQFAQPSSIVRVEEDRLELIRAGVIPPATLKRLASLMVLFVCTGNTCRSPMAESLMRRRFADLMKVDIDELDEHGIVVMSAGIAAMSGGRPSPEAIQVMQDCGLNLRDHESQPVTERLVRFADLILTMTRSHREGLLAQWPDAAPRAHLLARDGSDISDPIGGPLELYRQCAEQIDGALEGWVQFIREQPLLARCDIRSPEE